MFYRTKRNHGDCSNSMREIGGNDDNNNNNNNNNNDNNSINSGDKLL